MKVFENRSGNSKKEIEKYIISIFPGYSKMQE